VDNPYIQGFIEKCAEHSIDPEELIKAAFRGDILRRALAAVNPAAKLSFGTGKLFPAKGTASYLEGMYSNPGRYATELNAIEHPALRRPFANPGQAQGVRDHWAGVLKQVRAALKADKQPIASEALVSNAPANVAGTWK